MFIAHLPAGYLLTKAMQRRWPAIPLWAGLLGSVAPDLDLFYFYLVDGRRTLHHHYWTHLPLIWTALFVGGWFLLRAVRRGEWGPELIAVAANGLLHHLLDTPVGKILWAAPFSDRAFFLFTVPAVHRHWVLNFLFHWTAVFELLVCVAAFVVWRRERTSMPQTAPVDH